MQSLKGQTDKQQKEETLPSQREHSQNTTCTSGGLFWFMGAGGGVSPQKT